MEMILEYAVAGLFLAIFLATIFKDLKFFQNLWTCYPFVSHFVPSWNFFAPDPYQVDYYILYRLIDENDQVGTWKQPYHLEAMRSNYSFIWNPKKWFLKSSVD